MRNLILSTYHFRTYKDASPEQGELPDESGPRQAVRDIVGLLSLAHMKDLTPADSRAINAMTSGFTAEQFIQFRSLVARAIKERRELMTVMKAEAPTSFQADYARRILDDLNGIEKRWRETDADIVRLVADAEEVRVTGLEPNAQERSASRTEA